MSDLELRIRIPFSPRAKIGIKTVLLLVLFIAIGLGAFKWGRDLGNSEGYRSGYRSGYEKGWSDSMSAKITKAEYRVYDMLKKSNEHSNVDTALQDLVEEIQLRVDPSSWERNGGPATISVYPQNFSLLVHQTSRGHAAVSELIAQQSNE